MNNEADVTVSSHGGIVKLALRTAAAADWVDAYVDAEPYMRASDGDLYVEHRLAGDLINAMREHGLVVR